MRAKIDDLSTAEEAQLAEAAKVMEEYLRLLRRQIARIEFTYSGVLDMIAATDPAHRGAMIKALVKRCKETFLSQIETAKAYDVAMDLEGTEKL